MPTLHSVIAEADSHIYMPVLQQVAHHLLNSLNVTQYIKDAIHIETGWTVPKGTRKNHTFYVRGNTFRVVAEQHPYMTPIFEYQNFAFTGGHGFSASQLYTHHYPVLEDSVSEVTLHEMILPCSFSLNCSLWFTSRNVAYETMKRLMLRFTSGVIYSLSIAYDYPVPKDLVSVIHELYKHRKFDDRDPLFKDLVTAPDYKNVSFSDWLDKTSRALFVTTVSRTTKRKELCISKVIDNALIQVDHEIGKPEELRLDNIPEVYHLPFTVKIQFEESSALIAKYPCIIDSQLLGSHLIPELRRNDSPVTSQMPMYQNDLHNEGYKTLSAIRQLPTGEVKCPYYDDWKLPSGRLFFRSYRPFFTSIYTVDEAGYTMELDLKQPLYEEVQLHPVVKEILAIQGDESFKYDVFFNISSYAQDKPQIHSDMKLTSELMLTVKARDIHPQRHLVISEITDLRYLNPKWLYLLDKYPDFLPGDHGNATNRSFRIFRCNIVARNTSKRDPKTSS